MLPGDFRERNLCKLRVVTVIAVRCSPLRKILKPGLIILLKKRVLLCYAIRYRLPKSTARQPKNQPKNQLSHNWCTVAEWRHHARRDYRCAAGKTANAVSVREPS